MRWLRGILSYAAAVVLTTVLACAFSSHFVLWALSDLGVAIGAGRWLATLATDLVGMGPFYGGVIAVAFLIAFPVAALIIKGLRLKGVASPRLSHVGFTSAGAVAMLAALLILSSLLEVMPVAGARTPVGLAAQILAGVAGGFLFAWLTNRKSDESATSDESAPSA